MDFSASRGSRLLPAFLPRPSSGNAWCSSLRGHAANPRAAFQFFDGGIRDWSFEGIGGNQIQVAAIFRASLPGAADRAWSTLDGLRGIVRVVVPCLFRPGELLKVAILEYASRLQQRSRYIARAQREVGPVHQFRQA